jgi:Na+-translocating ferredoxin:NAD+ oxidoreductase RnfA subunit
MEDRRPRHKRLLMSATLLIEAFVVLHFLGVFSFMGPLLSLVSFVLAGVAFYFVRRIEDTQDPPHPVSR